MTNYLEVVKYASFKIITKDKYYLKKKTEFKKKN